MRMRMFECQSAKAKRTRASAAASSIANWWWCILLVIAISKVVVEAQVTPNPQDKAHAASVEDEGAGMPFERSLEEQIEKVQEKIVLATTSDTPPRWTSQDVRLALASVADLIATTTKTRTTAVLDNDEEEDEDDGDDSSIKGNRKQEEEKEDMGRLEKVSRELDQLRMEIQTLVADYQLHGEQTLKDVHRAIRQTNLQQLQRLQEQIRAVQQQYGVYATQASTVQTRIQALQTQLDQLEPKLFLEKSEASMEEWIEEVMNQHLDEKIQPQLDQAATSSSSSKRNNGTTILATTSSGSETRQSCHSFEQTAQQIQNAVVQFAQDGTGLIDHAAKVSSLAVSSSSSSHAGSMSSATATHHAASATTTAWLTPPPHPHTGIAKPGARVVHELTSPTYDPPSMFFATDHHQNNDDSRENHPTFRKVGDIIQRQYVPEDWEEHLLPQDWPNLELPEFLSKFLSAAATKAISFPAVLVHTMGVKQTARYAATLPPETVLHADTYPGSCWPMAGRSGRITLQLPYPILFSAVTVDHASKLLLMDPEHSLQSAPRHFKIHGYPSCSSTGEATTSCGGLPFDRTKKFFVTDFIFNVDGPSTQTFDQNSSPAATHGDDDDDEALLLESEEQEDSDDEDGEEDDDDGSCSMTSSSCGSPLLDLPPIAAVEFEIINNHGNPDYTCIYRLRVHGEPVS